jgi:hypothetical protein
MKLRNMRGIFFILITVGTIYPIHSLWVSAVIQNTTSSEIEYLNNKYPALMASLGVMLFSIDLETLHTSCGSFASNGFMIGYCYVTRYGENGIVWNFLNGPRGLVVLMDYPTAIGTWHTLEGAPQFYHSMTSVLPVEMNGAYGHAYVFVEEPTQ